MVETLKVIKMTDEESLAVLNVHIAARWKQDMKTGLQVVRRNENYLQSVTAESGFNE
jgi:hypothetical protein